MKNFKLHLVVFVTLLSLTLQTAVFSANESSKSQLATEEYQRKLLDALTGKATPDKDTILSALNRIFVGEYSENKTSNGKTTTTLVSQSELDKKADLYAKNFYDWYASNTGFISTIKDKEPFATAQKHDVYTIQSAVEKGMKKLLNNDLGYYIDTTVENRSKDTNALLSEKVEGGGSNDVMQAYIIGGISNNPFGSFGFTTNTSVPDALSVNALIGSDGYIEEEQGKNNSPPKKEETNAKLFINYLLQYAPLPKGFFIPSESSAINDKVTIYLPTASTDPNSKTAQATTQVSTKTTNSKGETITSSYNKMLDYLNKNSIYQEYKLKYRTLLTLQTIYHYIIFNLYQARLKINAPDPNQNNKIVKLPSLVEKEKAMAMEGLAIKYEDLKNKTVADINLETLHALNKIVYFLYKLHQDNERAQLMATISSMQLLNTSAFYKTYTEPILRMIQNKCWETEQLDTETQSDFEARDKNCKTIASQTS